MSALIKQACEHWRYVAPLLTKPTSEDDYDALVEALDELLAVVGDDEDHPLGSLASQLGDMIEAYDELHRPLPKVGGVEVLRYLISQRLHYFNEPWRSIKSIYQELNAIQLPSRFIQELQLINYLICVLKQKP